MLYGDMLHGEMQIGFAGNQVSPFSEKGPGCS